jgi:hypothetical protein
MAHQWDGNEQRWGKRIRVNIPVQLSSEDATSTDGFMKNVSLSGALMKAETDLRLHSLIHVSIPLLSPSHPASSKTCCDHRRLDCRLNP